MSEKALVKLLLAIARLGEADLFGWWNSRGFTEAGEYVLGESWPRTWQWSALEGDIFSAERKHAEVLGRPTALHLFSDRLLVKRWAIAWLREQKVVGHADGFLSRIRTWTKETAVRDIAEWAKLRPPQGEIIVECRRLGVVTENDLKVSKRSETLVRQLAAAYVDRSPEEFRFPYFEII